MKRVSKEVFPLTEQEYSRSVERWLDTAYRVALNCLRRPADAEDAVQEVFLRLWRTQPEFEGEEHQRRWIIRVTVNECRRIAVRPWYRHSVALEPWTEPVFSDVRDQELWEAVAALPEKYRLPLYLYYFEGYSVGETGELMGLKESTVQTRLGRAREKLKVLLTEG